MVFPWILRSKNILTISLDFQGFNILADFSNPSSGLKCLKHNGEVSILWIFSDFRELSEQLAYDWRDFCNDSDWIWELFSMLIIEEKIIKYLFKLSNVHLE